MSRDLCVTLPIKVAPNAPSTVFDVADTQAVVVSNAAVNSDYHHLILRADGVALNAQAGQFFNIACPATSKDLPFLRRPMSVYGVDQRAGHIEFLYKVTGAGTRGLATLQEGNTLPMLGPLGIGFDLQPEWRHIVVVGRGVGLATLAPLAEMAAARGVGISVILSARSQDLVMSVERFVNAKAHVDIVVDADGSSDPRNVERMLLGLVEDRKADAFFTCGSNRLMLLLKRVSAAFTIPGQVAMEQQMACGLRHVLLLRAHLPGRSRPRTAPRLRRRPGVQVGGSLVVVDLRVDIGDLALANPVMPASGTFSEGLARVLPFEHLGAFVTKTITAELRGGNPTPRVAEVGQGMLNSIGIPSKGVQYFVDHILPEYRRFSAPLVVSVSAPTAEQFADIVRQLDLPGIAAIEANISCPNIEEDGKAFAMRPQSTAVVVGQLRTATKLPLWVKLTPNTGDIAAVALAAEANGADALVVANTILAMSIDTETFRPRLGSLMGGYSGPAIKPVVLRMVYQCAKTVGIPVIGCGGISTVEDAVEYLLAGATAVQVGTATFVKPNSMLDIAHGLAVFCERKGIERVRDLIGAVKDTGMKVDKLEALQ